MTTTTKLGKREIRVNGHTFAANGCRCHVACLNCKATARRDECENLSYCDGAK